MRIDFEGKVAVVTGAASGIGRAVARAFAEAGATVAAIDVDAAGAEATARDIRAGGGRASGFELDVADRAAAAAVASRVADTLGAASFLVNNAGVQRMAGLDEPGAGEAWDAVIAVTLGGAFNMSLAFRPQLAGEGGAIVNVASVMSFIGAARQSAYAAAKAGLVNFTQSLSVELAPAGVRVNAVAPGLVRTGMTRALMRDEERLATILPRISLAREGRTEEIAWPILFLCSPLAAYVTGATLRVDGGWLAR